MTLKIGVLIKLFFLSLVSARINISRLSLETVNPAFNPRVYEDALDPVQCQEHLRFIRNSTLLRFRFLESGIRFPKGILQGNFLEMGNYWECLNINQPLTESTIEGKYCVINPNFGNLTQIARALETQNFEEDLFSSDHLDEAWNSHKKWLDTSARVLGGLNRSSAPSSDQLTLSIALCIPKTCTVEEGLRGIYVNLTMFSNMFQEEFCRFKNDKPWVPADYVSITILSLIGLLTIISTSFDLWHIFYLKSDSKSISALGRSFSVYTNAIRLTTFSKNPNNLECVDGIRTISILWIIVGHTYITTLLNLVNLIDVLSYATEIESLWIRIAPFTVDTFFLLSGMLLVYTTCGKISGTALLKRLHLFYLSRLLRMLPLLAVVILFQMSILHHIADGPIWEWSATLVNNCRTYWWTTLLYVQNFTNPMNQCIQHGWYLAIDMHFYILSPLVLYWLVKGKKAAIWSLVIALTITSVILSVYSFVYDFEAWNLVTHAKPESPEFMEHYYFNTVSRGPVFVTGMIFGFMLHTWRGKRVVIPRIVALAIWVCCFGTFALLIWLVNLLAGAEWDNYVVDGLINSFSRTFWGIAVGWVIFACHFGYGGPINWFLSHKVWKLPARVSYAMYLFHFPIQFTMSGTAVTPMYFVNDATMLYQFAAQASIFYGLSILLTLVVDSPFSVLFKLMLEGPKKQPPKKENEENHTKLETKDRSKL